MPGLRVSGCAGEGVVPVAVAAGIGLRLSEFRAGGIAGFVHSCAFGGEFCRFRGGGSSSFDDESGGFELDAGGSFGVAENVAEGLVGEADQGDGFLAEHPIAVGEGLLEGGFEMGKLAAPGKNVLAENVGQVDGVVDGAAGGDHEDHFLLFGGELDFGQADLITSNTITGERADTGRGEGANWL